MESGYDYSSRHSYRLLQGRLGNYDKRPYNSEAIDPLLKGIGH